MAVYRIDNRVRRGERRIDSHACRHRALGFLWMIEQFLWKLHGPANIRDASIQFAIDEIRAASKEQPDRRSNNEIVAEVSPRNFVPVRVVKSERQQAKHPAVARHAAFPDAQDRQRLAQHFWFVEENVADPSANDHAEQRAAGDKVAHSLRGKIRVPMFGEPEEK